ncbi:zinc finger MYM-type protein 1-like, partial [Aphis craccivora]
MLSTGEPNILNSTIESIVTRCRPNRNRWSHKMRSTVYRQGEVPGTTVATRHVFNFVILYLYLLKIFYYYSTSSFKTYRRKNIRIIYKLYQFYYILTQNSSFLTQNVLKPRSCEKRKRILEHELQKAGNNLKQTKLTTLFKTSTSKVETKTTPANQINLEKSNNSESIECFQNIENLIRSYDDPIKISQPYDHHKMSYYSIDNETKSDDDSDSDNSNSNFTSSKNCTLSTMNANLGLFIALNENETLVVKMDFIKKHPVQLTPDLHNFPFDFSRVYFRSINDGTEHKWLSFDNVSSKIYCSVCMTFGKNRYSVFVKGIDINLKSIYIKINKHEKSNVHNEAVSMYLRLDSGNSVKALIHIQRSKEVQENRLVMLRIIDIILTLAKQDIAFRGHIRKIDTKPRQFSCAYKTFAKYDSILLNHVQKYSLKSESLRKSRNEKANSISKKSGRGSLLTFLSKTTVNKI